MIGNQLDIKLRQDPSAELSFVTFDNTGENSYSNILIDTNDQIPGEYTLNLQSYNELSIAKSTLKADKI